MSDRDALLEAIRAHPREDTPRLEYADWLQEHGATDLDRATEEFIRLSCTMRNSNVMPRVVYPWLLSAHPDGTVVENWKRLLPSVMAVDRANLLPSEDPDVIGTRRGRCVCCGINVPTRPEYRRAGMPPARAYSMAFEFHRGFAIHAVVHTPYAAGEILEALYRDQPLVELHVPGLTRGREADRLCAELERVAGGRVAADFRKRVLGPPAEWAAHDLGGSD